MVTTNSVPTISTNSEENAAERARLTGRQLAEHPLLASRTDDDRPSVAEVLDDARPLLSTYGVVFDILRTRPGMVVLRARSDGRVTTQVACELVKGLLSAVPEQVCDVKASLMESTCAQRGAPACLFSMVWGEQENPVRLLAPPSPETLIDPPGESMFIQLNDAPIEWDRPIRSVPDSSFVSATPLGFEPASGPAQTPWSNAGGPASDSPVPSITFPYQVSTPNATAFSNPPGPAPAPAPVAPVSSPAPAAPPASMSSPAPVAAVVAPRVADVGATTAAVPGRRHFSQGLFRRSWLLALALVAGSAGGWFAGVHAGTTYGAQATLVVQSGAGKAGPGSANDALALATTYSALIPKDQSILSYAGSALGVSTTTVERDLTVTVESGTSLLLLDFSAPTAAQAVAGADAVARAVSSDTSLTAAIAAGSIAVVNAPSTAHKQGTLHNDGLAIGGFLGLVVGLILVLAAERADPRVDDSVAMAAAAGCRAALIPNDLSFDELARALADTGAGRGLTIVPIAISDTASTMELARGLRPCWPADGPSVGISPAFSSGVVELSRGSGPTVLVSHPGSRQRDVQVAAERLRMIGRTPVWAVLANRRLGSRVSDRVG